MLEKKVIGIVGGMGPKAGVMLHQKIIDRTDAKKDQDHLPVIHYSFSSLVPDRTAFLEGAVDENPAHQILKIIENLYASGASVITIPCNTSHAPRIYDVINRGIQKRHMNVELKHIVHESITCLKNQYPKVHRVAVMGTNGTYKSNIYNYWLEENGFDVCVPSWALQNQFIHRMVYDQNFGIKACNEIRPEVLLLLDQVLSYFIKEGVELVILGCTEFSLLPEEVLKPLKIIDSLNALADASIMAAQPTLINKYEQ